jgi:hypothetical protein
MTQLTLDPLLSSRFGSMDSEVELRDERGQLLGYFVPPHLHRELVLAWSRANVTDEELDAARREPGGRSLQEILVDLTQR